MLGGRRSFDITIDFHDNLIHCARRSLSMAFRPLLRQVSNRNSLFMAPINVFQRAVVPAMATAVTAGIAFAPRIADAEEQQGDLKVRRHCHSNNQSRATLLLSPLYFILISCDRVENPYTTSSPSTQQYQPYPPARSPTRPPSPTASRLPTA